MIIMLADRDDDDNASERLLLFHVRFGIGFRCRGRKSVGRDVVVVVVRRFVWLDSGGGGGAKLVVVTVESCSSSVVGTATLSSTTSSAGRRSGAKETLRVE